MYRSLAAADVVHPDAYFIQHDGDGKRVERRARRRRDRLDLLSAAQESRIFLHSLK